MLGKFVRTFAICLAVCGCALAIRSRPHTDIVAMLAHGDVQYIASHNGGIGVWFSRMHASDEVTWQAVLDRTSPVYYRQQLMMMDDTSSARVFKWRGIGVSWGTAFYITRFPYASIELPDWALTLPSLWLVVRWYRRALRRAAWREEGRCAECGYDLRGNPAAERCADCGSRVEGSSGALDASIAAATAPRG